MENVVDTLQSIYDYGLDYPWSFKGVGIPLIDSMFWPSLIAAIVYFPIIFGLKRYMRDRQPFQLKGLLALWNFLLAGFSLIAGIYVVPMLLHVVRTKGLETAICDTTCHDHPGTFWVLLFCFSKIPEMIDTVFIVLRKRPLIFLHYYHHLMTHCYCWFANIYTTPDSCIGHWFAAMNLIVHTIMYTYYGMASMGARPTWGIVLTALQISQMVVGIWTAWMSTKCKPFDPYDKVFLFTFGMYLSYFYLFSQLFYSKYLSKDDTRLSKRVKGLKDQ